jgi:hypothetical protein
MTGLLVAAYWLKDQVTLDEAETVDMDGADAKETVKKDEVVRVEELIEWCQDECKELREDIGLI